MLLFLTTNPNNNKHRPATTYSCTRLALDWEIPVGAGRCGVGMCVMRAHQTPTSHSYLIMRLKEFKSISV